MRCWAARTRRARFCASCSVGLYDARDLWHRTGRWHGTVKRLGPLSTWSRRPRCVRGRHVDGPAMGAHLLNDVVLLVCGGPTVVVIFGGIIGVFIQASWRGSVLSPRLGPRATDAAKGGHCPTCRWTKCGQLMTSSCLYGVPCRAPALLNHCQASVSVNFQLPSLTNGC